MKPTILHTILILSTFIVSPVMGQDNCPDLTQKAKFLSTELNKVVATIATLNSERERIEAEMANANAEELPRLTSERDSRISRADTQSKRQQELINEIVEVGGMLNNCEQ